MNNVEIYTDGSCFSNGVQGVVAGWGFLVVFNDNIIYSDYGYVENGTNNIGELTAIIKAMEYIKKEGISLATIYSDSNYCIRGITEWSAGWKKNGWVRSGRQTLKNRELWILVDELKRSLPIDSKIIWQHIKGHSGNKYNEMVDGLARKGTGEGIDARG